MTNTRLLSVFLILSSILAISGCGYLQVNPPPDINQDETLRININWQVAAANMLASSGYGAGKGIQEQADNIFAQINEHFGNKNTGWTDAALEWWLHSEHNVWQNNPYKLITVIGYKESKKPWADPEGSMKLGQMAREGHFLAIGITWPSHYSLAGNQGTHILNYIGDSQKKKRVREAPEHIRVTDPFRNKGGSIQTYKYDDFKSPNPEGIPSGEGWYFNYDENHPYIFMVTILSPVDDPAENSLCNFNLTSLRMKHHGSGGITNFSITTETDSNLAGFHLSIDRPIKREPKVSEEISRRRNITFEWNLSTRTKTESAWLTATAEVMTGNLHEMIIKDAVFSDKENDDIPGLPFLQWNIVTDEVRNVLIPNISGGYIIGRLELYKPDSIENELTGELIFETRYSMFESPGHHSFTVAADSGYLITNISLGHSYEYLPMDDLWDFTNWISMEKMDGSSSDSVTIKNSWTHLNYPEAGSYFKRSPE